MPGSLPGLSVRAVGPFAWAVGNDPGGGEGGANATAQGNLLIFLIFAAQQLFFHSSSDGGRRRQLVAAVGILADFRRIHGAARGCAHRWRRGPASQHAAVGARRSSARRWLQAAAGLLNVKVRHPSLTARLRTEPVCTSLLRSCHRLATRGGAASSCAAGQQPGRLLQAGVGQGRGALR